MTRNEFLEYWFCEHSEEQLHLTSCFCFDFALSCEHDAVHSNHDESMNEELQFARVCSHEGVVPAQVGGPRLPEVNEDWFVMLHFIYYLWYSSKLHLWYL